MERLTKPLCGGYELPMIPAEIKTQDDLEKFHEVRKFYESCAIRCGQYEDTGLEPGDLKSTADIDYVRIIELLKADKAGKLVVLPCKVGTPVYTTHWWKDVKEKCTDSHGKPFYRMVSKKIIKKERFDPFGPHYEWLGQTVFLTREEAEAALALKGGEG